MLNVAEFWISLCHAHWHYKYAYPRSAGTSVIKDSELLEAWRTNICSDFCSSHWQRKQIESTTSKKAEGQLKCSTADGLVSCLKTVGDRAFAVVSPRRWNDLPNETVNCQSFLFSRRKHKTICFNGPILMFFFWFVCSFFSLLQQWVWGFFNLSHSKKCYVCVSLLSLYSHVTGQIKSIKHAAEAANYWFHNVMCNGYRPGQWIMHRKSSQWILFARIMKYL